MSNDMNLDTLRYRLQMMREEVEALELAFKRHHEESGWMFEETIRKTHAFMDQLDPDLPFSIGQHVRVKPEFWHIHSDHSTMLVQSYTVEHQMVSCKTKDGIRTYAVARLEAYDEF